MSETPEHSQSIIRWDKALDMRTVSEERDRLIATLDAAAASGTKIIRIEAPSRHDHIARQLIAATRKSATDTGVTIEVTAADGDWDDVAIVEDAA